MYVQANSQRTGVCCINVSIWRVTVSGEPTRISAFSIISPGIIGASRSGSVRTRLNPNGANQAAPQNAGPRAQISSASSSLSATTTSRSSPSPSPGSSFFPSDSASSWYTSYRRFCSARYIGGRIAVTPSRAHQRIVFSLDANGWKIGGCGFCSGFGTTPIWRTMSFASTPAPHCFVASSAHGVPAGGICQYFPLNSSISSVHARLMIWKCSSNASRFARSISSCSPGVAP